MSAPVTVSTAGGIELMPKTLIDCATAATLAAWLQDTVAPKAEAMLGAKLTAIRVLDGYDCRTVDNIPGANVSLHARGKAIDIGAFKVGNRWITVGATGPQRRRGGFPRVGPVIGLRPVHDGAGTRDGRVPRDPLPPRPQRAADRGAEQGALLPLRLRGRARFGA